MPKIGCNEHISKEKFTITLQKQCFLYYYFTIGFYLPRIR